MLVIGSAVLTQKIETMEGKYVLLQLGKRSVQLPVDEFPDEKPGTQFEFTLKPIGSGYDKNPLGSK